MQVGHWCSLVPRPRPLGAGHETTIGAAIIIMRGRVTRNTNFINSGLMKCPFRNPRSATKHKYRCSSNCNYTPSVTNRKRWPTYWMPSPKSSLVRAPNRWTDQSKSCTRLYTCTCAVGVTGDTEPRQCQVNNRHPQIYAFRMTIFHVKIGIRMWI